MGKSAAFGTQFSIGTCQVETGQVIGTIVNAGNAKCVTTCTGMTGSPITTTFAVLSGDTADTVATKARTALQAVGNITALFSIGGSGPYIVLTKLVAAADIANLNIQITNDTCTGLTDSPTSVNTIAGAASVNVAYISNIGGPGLAVDTVDVTTHDQTVAWEEVVASIMRSGEVSLDLEYDPNAASHSFSTDGLGDRYEFKKVTYCKITFPGSFIWSFSAYVTGYEPSGPVDAPLTAAVKLKITGAPTLV